MEFLTALIAGIVLAVLVTAVAVFIFLKGRK